MRSANEVEAGAANDGGGLATSVFSSGAAGLKTYQNKYAWLVWSISAFFVFFQFCLQLSSGEIVQGLMRSFSLTALGAGILTSAYYYIYVVLQIPAGMLMDRFGPRKLLSVGAVIVVMGCALFGMTQDLSLAFLARVLMGGGAAFAFVGCMNLIARWFPAERFGIMTAIVETTGVIGSLLGGILLAVLVQGIGWRACMEGAAVIALLIGGMTWAIVRDAPSNVTNIIVPPKGAFASDFKKLLKKRVVWVNAIYSAASFSVVTVFVALWGVPFIQVEHHLSLTMATVVANMVFAGVAVGSPIIGYLDMRTSLRRQLLMTCALVSALLMSVVIFLPHLPLSIVMVTMFFLGVFSSSYIVTFVIANELATPTTRSTSIGFVNTWCVGTAPVMQPLIGLVLYLLNSHAAGKGVVHYSLHQYQAALVMIPLLLIVGAGLARFIPNRHANG